MGSSGGTHTTSSRDEKKPQTTAQRKRAMYLRMFELMGLGNHKVVVNMLVTKVCNNMKFWASNKEVISKSLNVFFWLSAGYGSGRFMLTLDSVKYLLTHHTSQHLPFLDLAENTKSRTTFYKTLTRLVFLGDYHTLLMPFMEPILTSCSYVAQQITTMKMFAGR